MPYWEAILEIFCDNYVKCFRGYVYSRGYIYSGL